MTTSHHLEAVILLIGSVSACDGLDPIPAESAPLDGLDPALTVCSKQYDPQNDPFVMGIVLSDSAPTSDYCSGQTVMQSTCTAWGTVSAAVGTPCGFGCRNGACLYAPGYANIVSSPYLADPTGKTNACPAIQKALDAVAAAGGGRVFVPAGTYLVDACVLRIGTLVELVGEGDTSVLVRGKTPGIAPANVVLKDGKPTQTAGCGADIGMPGALELISNSGYGCGNSYIRIRKLKLVGTAGKAAVTWATAKPTALSVLIALSAVEHTTLEYLTIRDPAQDAIFVRNGGTNTTIRHNDIRGIGAQWGNACGITVEHWNDGLAFATGTSGNPVKPVVIENNHVVVDGPHYCGTNSALACDVDTDCGVTTCTAGRCSANTAVACTSDAQCGCAGGQSVVVAGIAASYHGAAKYHPMVDIRGNWIEVDNLNHGIKCQGCTTSNISSNTITPIVNGTSVAGPALAGRSHGIKVEGSLGTIKVLGNSVAGSGAAADGYGIVVQGSSGNAGSQVSNNTVKTKQLGVNMRGLWVRRLDGFEAIHNDVSEAIGGHSTAIAFAVGETACSAANAASTTNGVISLNYVSWTGSGGALVVRSATKNTYSSNYDDDVLTNPAFYCPASTGVVYP